jgi:hypothetical protein
MGDGDTLWLEEGVLPVKGQIVLNVFMYNPSLFAYELAQQTSAGGDKETKETLTAAVSAATPPPAGGDATATVDDSKRNASTSPPVTPSSPPPTSGETKESKADLAGGIAPLTNAAAGGNKNKLLLTALFQLPFSSQWTLGDLKTALHTYPNSPLSGVKTSGHIRIRHISKADEIGKMLCGDDLTLAKCGINTDKKIAVQVGITHLHVYMHVLMCKMLL